VSAGEGFSLIRVVGQHDNFFPFSPPPLTCFSPTIQPLNLLMHLTPPLTLSTTPRLARKMGKNKAPERTTLWRFVKKERV